MSLIAILLLYLAALVKKYNQVMQRYFVQYLSGYDAVVLNQLIQVSYTTIAGRGSLVVERRTRNRENPGSNPPFATVSKFGHIHSLHDTPVHSAV